MTMTDPIADFLTRLRNAFIPHHVTVPKMNVAIRVSRDIRLVGYQNQANRLLAIEPLKNGHDFDTGTGIERAGRLVCQYDLRIVD